jgi:hypothetical protein
VRHRKGSLDSIIQRLIHTTRVTYSSVRVRPVPFLIINLGLPRHMHDALTRDA